MLLSFFKPIQVLTITKFENNLLLTIVIVISIIIFYVSHEFQSVLLGSNASRKKSVGVTKTSCEYNAE